MKTPMQEHIEWLKKEKDEHGYEKHSYFECSIEHAEAMLVKERAFYWLRPKCDWCNGNNSPHMLQDTDGCSNDRSKCSCKNWGGCPVD